MQQHDSIRAIQWQDEQLVLLDQRLLPNEEHYLSLNSVNDVAQAITDMVVRGAPAIGITAAYGIVIAARDRYQINPHDWKTAIEADLQLLANARPTAVNLHWAIERMRRAMQVSKAEPVACLLQQAHAIHEEDIQANLAMGKLGAELIDADSGVLTHCNTGSLATGGYGTALGVIRSASHAGKLSHVYADETRPWLQGARLTAWELVKDQIPVDLIVDGAAAWLMKQGEIDWVIVGSDRITRNGDVANKIGTYSTAVLARHHGVKFMVVAPTSTIDMTLRSGKDIPIEYRAADEITRIAGQAMAPAGTSAWNPVFDITPAELVSAIVTEKGVVMAPTTAKMEALMGLSSSS